MAVDDQDVSLVVITALPVEQVAVKQILDRVDGEFDGFIFGSVTASGAVAHRLAVGLLPQPGNSTAASAVADWAARFTNARYLVMVGIAGGIPAPEDPERHVRLGDVVVSDSTGVREHDRGKIKTGEFEPLTGGMSVPSSQFVAISRQLVGGAIVGGHPWQDVLAERFGDAIWARPSADTDVLTDPSGPIGHPDPDPFRTAGIPRLVPGMIASGNLVVKDRDTRDALARLGAVAIEMESAGIAAGAWITEREHFAVRGIVDYADGTKTNAWHNYGSAAAAAALRAILDRKSPTILEVPSPLSIDGVQASYTADLRGAIASAIVEAESSRRQVIEIVHRWQVAHDTLNRRPIGYNADTGEALPSYLPRQQVDSFTADAVAALTAARDAVAAKTAAAATTIDLLVDVTDHPATNAWLVALKESLADLVAAAATWPAAPSRNKYEPPPGDDGGVLADSIQVLRSTLSTTLRSLAGLDVTPAPEPALPEIHEPSEFEQRVQQLHDLAERLSPYGRVDTKPYSSEDHHDAVAAAAELIAVPSIALLNVGLGAFADLAARVARNARPDEWVALVDQAAHCEPLLHAVQLLVAYREVLEQLGSADLSARALEAATERLAALPQLVERDDFWDAATGENIRRLVEFWASAGDHHDASALLGSLAFGSRTGLCRVLDVLAGTIQRTNQFTDETRYVREVHNRFGTLERLVRPEDIRRAITEFLPDLPEPVRADDDVPECERFAAQFLNEFPP